MSLESPTDRCNGCLSDRSSALQRVHASFLSDWSKSADGGHAPYSSWYSDGSSQEGKRVPAGVENAAWASWDWSRQGSKDDNSPAGLQNQGGKSDPVEVNGVCLGAPWPWQELQQTLLREWTAFSQVLEGQLEDHFHQQELLMNQQALRIEGILTSCTQAERDEHRRGGLRWSCGTSSVEPKKTSGRVRSLSEDRTSDFSRAVELSRSAELGRATRSTATSSPSADLPTRDDSNQTVGKETSIATRSPKRHRSRRQSFSVRFGIVDNVDNSGHFKRQRSMSLRLEKIESRLGVRIWNLVGNWVDWWLELKEPPPEGLLATLVDSKIFELMCAFIILCNSAVTVYTTNFEAAHLYDDKSLHMRLLNMAFTLYYSTEIILKITVHKQFFFCNNDMAWNIFDFILVMLAVFDLFYSEMMDQIEDSVDLNHMRTVRILRTTRILRMVRLIRFFSELKLIMNSVLGSLVSLFWSVMMLIFMFFIFSLIFVQGATITMINNDDMAITDKNWLSECLGSTQLGMLMLFKSATGGEDWTNYYRAIQMTGSGNCALFLFFIAFAQFALLNILTGLYVEKAMKLAQPDRDTVALQQRQRELHEADELRKLCASIDTTNSGFISEEQFLATLQNGQFRARLALLGLDIKDASFFFRVICSSFDKREVEIDAFVSGAMRLKGQASSLDLQALAFGTKLIHSNQIKFYNQVEERLEKIMSQLRRS